MSERDTAKLVRQKQKLALLENGGAPDRPIVVASASVVETHARALPCPLCDGPMRLEEHVVEQHGAARLRVARMVCTRCGAPRALYYRIAQPN